MLNSTPAICRFISQQNKCCYDTLCFDSKVFNLTQAACVFVFKTCWKNGVNVTLSSNLTNRQPSEAKSTDLKVRQIGTQESPTSFCNVIQAQ